MDEEFEQVIEFVGEEVDGAGLCLGEEVLEGEGLRGFVADGEGDVLEVAMAVGDLYVQYIVSVLRSSGRSGGCWEILTCSPVSIVLLRHVTGTISPAM